MQQQEKKASEPYESRSRSAGTEQVHVKSQIVNITLSVTGGSDTDVLMNLQDIGGFLTAYGDQGHSKLQSLQRAIANATQDWFNQNPANFSVGRSNR